MRDKRSEGAKALMARARRDLISRTARVWSKLARSIIKERGAELDAWISRLMANAEEATTKGTELDVPPFPGGWADALRDDLIYAMAQGFWLQHVYMQEARAERQGKRYRVPEGDPTKAALEALTKRKMTLADSDDWHKVIPKDAIDWIEGYTPKLAGTLQKDVLERVKREVQGSLAKGTSVRERVKALREASPKVAAMSKARVEAIARTEVTRADTMGRLLSMKRDEDVIGVEFSAVLDSRTTPGCERRHGLVMRLDDPRLPENAPPRHVNCRSMLLPVSKWDAPDGLLTSHEFDDVDMPRGGQRPEDVEVVRAVLGMGKWVDDTEYGLGRLITTGRWSPTDDDVLVRDAIEALRDDSDAIREKIARLHANGVKGMDEVIEVGDLFYQPLRRVALESGENVRQNIARAINEFRPLGGGMLDVQALGTDRRAVDVLTEAASLLPRDWVEAINRSGKIYAAMADKSVRGRGCLRTSSLGGRVRYDIFIDASGVDCAIHELSHILQKIRYADAMDKAPIIKSLERQLFRERTKGCSVERLAHFFNKYRDDEYTKRDKFVRPYMGKVRSKGQDDEPAEIFTMGLEYAYSGNSKFWRKDPQYVKWTLGTLTGVRF